MHLGEVDVWIACGDMSAALPEYSIKAEDDGITISCYIPSEAGKVRQHLFYVTRTIIFL